MIYYNLQRYDVTTHIVDGVTGHIDRAAAFFLTNGNGGGVFLIDEKTAEAVMLLVGRPGELNVSGNYLWKLTIA